MAKSPLQYDLPNLKPAPRQRANDKAFTPGPNPELPDFIRQHATPYNPVTDNYDVPAFSRDILVDKAHPPKAIYDMHTYWSKKHWAAIRQYIRHYLPKSEYPAGTGLVLDCFSGSGMTGVAAMMEDRPCVLIDASPAAAFISHCYTHPVDPQELQDTYDAIMTEPYDSILRAKLKKATGNEILNLKQELDWLYDTRCDRCGGLATTEYVVYSERFQCSSCNEIVAISDCPEIKSLKKARYCPKCLIKNHGEPSKDFAINTRSKKFGAIPVKVVYECQGKCKPKRGERVHNADQRTRSGRYFQEYDLAKIAEIKGAIPHWYPHRHMMDVKDDSKPWGVKWRAGSANFRKVEDLYSYRNLWALAALREAIDSSVDGLGPAHIVMTVPSLTCSRMLREKKRAIQSGTYYIPLESRHIKVTNAFNYGKRIIHAGQEALYETVSQITPIVSNASVLQEIAEVKEMFDYVFTDPPYLNLEVQYGELNFVWDAWLDFNFKWSADEITWNPVRGITWSSAEERLRQSIAAIFSALKPGRFASICYHDTSEANWKMLQDAVLDSGFQLQSVTTLDPKQKSQKQTTAEKIVKSDLVLNCRKPRINEREGRGAQSDLQLVSARVRDILLETLSFTGGQARDKLWDTILKRLLTHGQMAAHRFDDILAEIAFRSESGRWFLKEEFEQLSQNDIKNEGEAGASIERFARLRLMGVPVEFAAKISIYDHLLAGPDADENKIEKHIAMNFADDPTARKFKLKGRLKGVEFYDCLFFYLTRFLKGRPGGKTPRRNLAEFLEEYLVRFKDGDKWLYRPPDRFESETLRKSRQTGVGRRIRQYAAFLQGLGDFPREKMPDSKTLLAWLKHCSTFGLVEEGVKLFEKGGLQLQPGTEDYYDADEYYRNCKRKASKSQADDDDTGYEQDAEETEE